MDFLRVSKGLIIYRRKLLREGLSSKDDWWSNCSKAAERNVKLKKFKDSVKHRKNSLMQRKSTNGDRVYLTK